MPRFVILEHDWPTRALGLSSWNPGSVLRAWRLLAEPAPGMEVPAEPNADHRLLYLDYEGPVSGGRGTGAAMGRGHLRVARGRAGANRGRTARREIRRPGASIESDGRRASSESLTALAGDRPRRGRRRIAPRLARPPQSFRRALPASAPATPVAADPGRTGTGRPGCRCAGTTSRRCSRSGPFRRSRRGSTAPRRRAAPQRRSHTSTAIRFTSSATSHTRNSTDTTVLQKPGP